MADGKGRVGLRNIARNNKRWNLGPDRFLSEVSDTPHGPVARIKKTYTMNQITG